MRSILKLSASLICTGILALFAIFVWPTRFRYEHIQNQVLLRIDRFTDEMSYLDVGDGKWTSIKPTPTPTAKEDYKPQLPPTPNR